MVSSPAAKLRSQIMTARNHGELPKLPLSDLPPHHAPFDLQPHHAASSPQGGSSSSAQEEGRVGTEAGAGSPKKRRRRKRNRKKQVAAQSGAGGAGIAEIVAPKAEVATPPAVGRGEGLATGTPRPPSVDPRDDLGGLGERRGDGGGKGGSTHVESELVHGETGTSGSRVGSPRSG